MATSYDVVVVGAGPAGSSAARAAAAGGARTLLLDRRPTIGEPVQCGEFLPDRDELADLLPAADTLDEAYQIPPSSIARRTRSMSIVSPYGRRYTFPLGGVCVSRALFDRALADRAVAAGAELRHPVGVTRVRDGDVELADGSEVQGTVIIGADGPISTVARGAGFRAERSLYRMITATSAGSFDDEIVLAFGDVAPGGYAWIFPKGECANVGLGVPSVPHDRSLSSMLDAFAARSELSTPTDRTRWWVPIGPPPDSLVAGRALLCGDAANLVMATNGAGIPTAMLSGHDAGVVAAAHVAGRVPLTDYDRLWRAHMLAPLARGARLQAVADRVARNDLLLALGMRFIGAHGLDEMMRLRWPSPLGWVS